MVTAVPQVRLSRRVLADSIAPLLSRPLRTAALVVTGAGLVGISAQLSVHIPGTPVPVTGQTLAVLLVAAALGWRDAATSMALYAVAGGLGMPWFASGRSGWGGATFGYILGFIIAATVVGHLAARGGDRSVARTTATMAVGTALIYAVGVPWLAQTVHVSLTRAWAIGARPFLAGDAIKMLLAAGLLPAAWAALNRDQKRH